MAILKLLSFGAALFAAQTTLAAPIRRSTCDFNTPTPDGWTDSMDLQWCGMINNEVAALKAAEDPLTMLPVIGPIFKQAGISADPACVLGTPEEIMSYPAAQAAMKQMKANFPAFGSMDLTAEDIPKVYADPIKAACTATGAPEDLLTKMIWTESKGHPLISNGGLTQIDNVAFGQQVQKNPNLKNRYTPADNIMAAAMRLKQGKDEAGCDWETAYYQHYQDPGAAARGY